MNLTAHPKTERFIVILCCLFIIVIPQYGVILAFILAAVYIRRNRKNASFIQSLGFKKPENIIQVLVVGLFVGIGIELAFEILINPAIEHITKQKIDLSEFNFLQGNMQAYLTWMLIGWILGGFMEEILFRGFIFTRITAFLNNKSYANIIGSLFVAFLFGICHLYQGAAGMLSTGLIGFIFCWIFILSGRNIWFAIATHGFVNMVGFTVLYLGKYDFLNTLLFK